MQLKLLNLHKLLANIATNLVGAFIPLIVYNATGSLFMGVLAYALHQFIRIIFDIAFRKLFFKKPQLALLYRAIPIVLYSVSIILIDTHMWVGIIGAIVFYGINDSFKNIPKEVIYNYSTIKGTSGGLGVSRLIEQAGVVLAFVVGGYLLDISKVTVTIISLAVYVVSCVPLVIYYFKCKNDATFNKDFTSNAVETLTQKQYKGQTNENIVRKILRGYSITYLVYCTIDALPTAFMLCLMLTSSGSFASAGIYTAIFNGMQGIGSYVFGLIDAKHDTTPLIIGTCLVSAGCVFGIAFVTSSAWLYVLFALVGLSYGCLPVFMFQNLIGKARIIGASNRALFHRELASSASLVMTILFGAFGTILPVFIFIGATMGLSAYMVPTNEENTRKALVNYLQHNEITDNSRRSFALHKRDKNA